MTIASLSHLEIAGLPIAMVFGILAFIFLAITATLGYLVLKGKYSIPFRRHMQMAAVTFVFALIHIALVILQLYF